MAAIAINWYPRCAAAAAVQAAREAARSSQLTNNLKQIDLGMHDAFRRVQGWNKPDIMAGEHDFAREAHNSTSVITPGTVLGFLVGRRDAISNLAHCRGAIWIGLMFVISAGLAREYDGESLLHEPWHLLIPVGASLITSLVLFALLALATRLGGSFRGSFWNGYRSFLGVYWMTAPLAWLYAIPIERFASPADAVRANLFFLATVSCWRVALMTRIVSVIVHCRVISALMLVMLFADAVALSVLYLTPMPIFNVMGGIRLTESEQLIQSTHFFVGCIGIVTAPIWVIGGLAVLFASADKKAGWRWCVEPADDVRMSKPLWFVGPFSILIWAAVLPLTQPEQYNRWQVQQALAEDRIDDAVRYMAKRKRSDFPPHWDPPPRIGYGEDEPNLVEILDHLAITEREGWVRQIFIDKLRFQAENSDGVYLRTSFQLENMSDDRLSRYVRMLESVEGGDVIARSHSGELKNWFNNKSESSENATTERDRLLLRLKEMADRHSR